MVNKIALINTAVFWKVAHRLWNRRGTVCSVCAQVVEDHEAVGWDYI